jgi:hypothetical protein
MTTLPNQSRASGESSLAGAADYRQLLALPLFLFHATIVVTHPSSVINLRRFDIPIHYLHLISTFTVYVWTPAVALIK